MLHVPYWHLFETIYIDSYASMDSKLPLTLTPIPSSNDPILYIYQV